MAQARKYVLTLWWKSADSKRGRNIWLEERNSIYPKHKLVLKTTTAWAATNTQVYRHLPPSNSGVYTVQHETLRACTVQELCEFYFCLKFVHRKCYRVPIYSYRLQDELWAGLLGCHSCFYLNPVIIIQKSLYVLLANHIDLPLPDLYFYS